MKDFEKLADIFEKEVSTQDPQADVFGEISYFEESKLLAMLAGKIIYKAKKESDKIKSDKLINIGKLILRSSDLIKKV